ncbi:hypothetical protein C2G38_2253946 [Gigaspora rosea]|uniref:Uncharacterized protein n=1 Tax=Gigaspora rosea TaxID=44941 RepID=A0A397U692_9GLOM|nr:hypothetical protein C2G38_2253946 [Gigaspora rosea]
MYKSKEKLQEKSLDIIVSPQMTIVAVWTHKTKFLKLWEINKGGKELYEIDEGILFEDNDLYPEPSLANISDSKHIALSLKRNYPYDFGKLTYRAYIFLNNKINNDKWDCKRMIELKYFTQGHIISNEKLLLEIAETTVSLLEKLILEQQYLLNKFRSQLNIALNDSSTLLVIHGLVYDSADNSSYKLFIYSTELGILLAQNRQEINLEIEPSYEGTIFKWDIEIDDDISLRKKKIILNCGLLENDNLAMITICGFIYGQSRQLESDYITSENSKNFLPTIQFDLLIMDRIMKSNDEKYWSLDNSRELLEDYNYFEAHINKLREIIKQIEKGNYTGNKPLISQTLLNTIKIKSIESDELQQVIIINDSLKKFKDSIQVSKDESKNSIEKLKNIVIKNK